MSKYLNSSDLYDIYCNEMSEVISEKEMILNFFKWLPQETLLAFMKDMNRNFEVGCADLEDEDKYSIKDLFGENAYTVMGTVVSFMKQENCSDEEINAYLNDATNGDYGHLIAVSNAMVETLNEKYE